MKKSILAVIIATAGVLAATAAISAAAISTNNNKNTDSTETSGSYVSELSKVSENSGAVELALSADKEAIRKEIRNELRERLSKICSEMMIDGKEHDNINWDAEEQLGIEQINEAATIAKKYNRLDDDFTLVDIIENAECMRAVVDLLNSSENITLRERVFLEIYLEDNYYSLEWVEGAEKLALDIENTIDVPYGSVIDDMKKNAHLAADHISRPYQEKN